MENSILKIFGSMYVKIIPDFCFKGNTVNFQIGYKMKNFGLYDFFQIPKIVLSGELDFGV